MGCIELLSFKKYNMEGEKKNNNFILEKTDKHCIKADDQS